MPIEAAKKICVFCGSAPGHDERFRQLAQQFGYICAKNKWPVVYGGAGIGLMNEIANAVLEHKGKVIGVIPEHLRSKEVAHPGLSELHVTASMHERQKMMADLSDIFVVLPGGSGTMAEFFEIVTWKQIGLHHKPIIVFNALAYWEPLLSLWDKGERGGFIRQTKPRVFDVADTIDQLTLYLDKFMN